MIASIIALITRLQRPANEDLSGDWLRHETSSLADMIATIAESQIGVREGQRNNTGPKIVEYQKATWLPPGPWPWCAAFVCWVIYQTIRTLGISPAWNRPRTAGAYDFENWVQGKGSYKISAAGWTALHPRANAPRRGDLITFKWSHIGIVRSYDPKTRTVYTVEGNAGSANVRDGSSGDGVVSKTHPLSDLRCILRPPA